MLFSPLIFLLGTLSGALFATPSVVQGQTITANPTSMPTYAPTPIASPIPTVSSPTIVPTMMEKAVAKRMYLVLSGMPGKLSNDDVNSIGVVRAWEEATSNFVYDNWESFDSSPFAIRQVSTHFLYNALLPQGDDDDKGKPLLQLEFRIRIFYRVLDEHSAIEKFGADYEPDIFLQPFWDSNANRRYTNALAKLTNATEPVQIVSVELVERLTPTQPPSLAPSATATAVAPTVLPTSPDTTPTSSIRSGSQSSRKFSTGERTLIIVVVVGVTLVIGVVAVYLHHLDSKRLQVPDNNNASPPGDGTTTSEHSIQEATHM